MIKAHKNGIWIDLYDASDFYYTGFKLDDLFQFEIQGFWVVFIRENIFIDKDKRNEFINKAINFMHINNIPALRITKKYADRLILFTSCKKEQITLYKQLLIDYFGFSESNMLWEALFESYESWNENKWLNIMDSAYEKLESMIPKNSNNDPTYLNAQSLKSLSFQSSLEHTIKERTKMVVEPIFKNINYEIKKNTAFIIIPFGESWSDSISKIIKNICKNNSINAKRADDFFHPGVILNDIWREINESEVIIADISSQNANVFYELGIAHTIGKDVILINNNAEGIPFDINSQRYIHYYDDNDLQNKLDCTIKSYIERANV